MTHEERVRQQQELLVDTLNLPKLADVMIETQGHIYFLLTTYNLWSPEGTFTFPDGTTYEKKRWEQA